MENTKEQSIATRGYNRAYVLYPTMADLDAKIDKYLGVEA